MKIDLSFIPKEILSKSLSDLLNEEFEYPYVDEKVYAKNFLKSKRHGEGASPPDEIRQKRRNNFFCLEMEMISLGCHQKSLGNEELAERIFKFLVEIGSKNIKPKEQLVEYYQRTGNKRCLKWLIKRINDQLKCEELGNESEKLLELKKRIETFQTRKRKRRKKKEAN